MNMNRVSLPAACRTWLENFDAGAADPAHLAACEGCAREVEVRNKMFNRVRLAHQSAPAPVGLETRIRAAIRAEAEPRPAWRGASLWMMATAALLMMVGLGVAYQLGHMRFSRASQDAYIASIANQVASLLRPGLKDHVHCAYYRKFPKTPAQAKFLEELGPEYSDLLHVVKRYSPNGYQLVTAHKCGYEDRRYVHLALKKGGSLVSLVIAAKGAGESFATEQLRPDLQTDGRQFFQAGVQRFAVSAFETDRHLVYTVSDLTAAENMNLMVAMAPQVSAVLARAL